MPYHCLVSDQTPHAYAVMAMSQGRILVVDDSRSERAIVSSLLKRQGWLVETAESGSAALAKVKEFSPHVLLLDVVLPDVDGFRLCRIIKSHEKFKDLPVIFLTSLDKKEDVLAGFKAGGADYVSKPFQAEELVARVGAHLQLALLHEERLRQQAELAEARERLERATLAEGLAHNLNNMLGAMLGNLTWLESQLQEPEHLEAVRDVLEVARKLQEVARALTGATPFELGRPEPLGRILSRVCDTFEERLPPQVSLVRDFDPQDETPVPGALERILHELLRNALEATQEGQIRVSAHIREGELLLQVEDTGRGLDEETARKAFLPFFSTKDIVGAGLGLHTVRVTLERLGGTVTLEARPEGGAVARVTLPLAQG